MSEAQVELLNAAALSLKNGVGAPEDDGLTMPESYATGYASGFAAGRLDSAPDPDVVIPVLCPFTGLLDLADLVERYGYTVEVAEESTLEDAPKIALTLLRYVGWEV